MTKKEVDAIKKRYGDCWQKLLLMGNNTLGVKMMAAVSRRNRSYTKRDVKRVAELLKKGEEYLAYGDFGPVQSMAIVDRKGNLQAQLLPVMINDRKVVKNVSVRATREMLVRVMAWNKQGQRVTFFLAKAGEKN